MLTDGNRIEARPDKQFFIEMLTRDIRLIDCILDLVDNSVHSLVRRKSLDVTEGITEGKWPRLRGSASVNLTVERSSFTIVDTCGGIPIDEARESVFRFGSTSKETGTLGLSVFGIGMKRAFFKLGRMIAMRSRTEDEEF